MSYSVSVSLQIWHPMLTCDQLQSLFMKTPNIKHSVGENIICKGGKKIYAKYVDSYICYNIIPLQECEDLIEPIKKANNIVSDMLKDNMSLLELKKNEGKIIYYCAVYTKDHIVFTLPAEISMKMSGLGIDLGIEVFQEYIE